MLDASRQLALPVGVAGLEAEPAKAQPHRHRVRGRGRAVAPRAHEGRRDVAVADSRIGHRGDRGVVGEVSGGAAGVAVPRGRRPNYEDIRHGASAARDDVFDHRLHGRPSLCRAACAAVCEPTIRARHGARARIAAALSISQGRPRERPERRPQPAIAPTSFSDSLGSSPAGGAAGLLRRDEAALDHQHEQREPGAQLRVRVVRHRQAGELLDAREPVADRVLVDVERERRSAGCCAMLSKKRAQRRQQVRLRRSSTRPPNVAPRRR